MGVLGKIFGKKEVFDFEKQEKSSALPDFQNSLDQDSLGLDEKPIIPEHLNNPYTPSRLPGQVDEHFSKSSLNSRDLELINSKLDTIKAILNSMDQRIANLEKVAGVEQKRMPW